MLGMFLVAQFIGLYIVKQYLPTPEGLQPELPFGLAPPDINPSLGFIFILGGVLLGTGLVLLLVKFRRVGLWRVWFYLSATLALAVAFTPFIGELLALALSAILAFFKVFKPNVIIHNATELLLYGGLAAIFFRILNIQSAVILLVLISIYDAYAVWRSKHMVTMAQFQAESKVFAGILIPKKELKTKFIAPKIGRSSKTAVPAPKGASAAMLGGGDIAFPLLFASVVMKSSGFVPALFLIPLCAAAALGALLVYSQTGRFYPAMPFISAGTFVGYGLFFLATMQ